MIAFQHAVLKNRLILLLLHLGNGLFCDDKEVPPHSHVVRAPWFQKCVWDCDDGYERRSKTCCRVKPNSSVWSDRGEPCTWRCSEGFVRRRETCCAQKPAGTVWFNSSGAACAWNCSRGSELVDGRCVSDLVADVLREWAHARERAEAEAVVDDLISGLVADRLGEAAEEARARRERAFVEELLEGILGADSSAGNRGTATPGEERVGGEGARRSSAEVEALLDRLVDERLAQQRGSTRDLADQAEADVGTFADYLVRPPPRS